MKITQIDAELFIFSLRLLSINVVNNEEIMTHQECEPFHEIHLGAFFTSCVFMTHSGLPNRHYNDIFWTPLSVDLCAMQVAVPQSEGQTKEFYEPVRV